MSRSSIGEVVEPKPLKVESHMYFMMCGHIILIDPTRDAAEALDAARNAGCWCRKYTPKDPS